MENHIASQLVSFLQSVLLGLSLGLFYDLLRALRIRFARLGWLWDLFLCLTAGSACFLFLLRGTGGELRLYALMGLTGGSVVYFGLFSAPLRPVWAFWATSLAFFLQLLSLPPRWFWRFSKKMGLFFKNLFYFAKKCYTIRKIGVMRHVGAYKGDQKMAKTTQKARAKHKAGFFTKLLILLLLVALGWQLYALHSQVKDAKEQKIQLASQVEQTQKDNDTLQESIDRSGSSEEMKSIARDQLGLVSPGEKVFYDMSN